MRVWTGRSGWIETPKRERKKPERYARVVCWPLDEDKAGVLTITIGKVATVYRFFPIATYMGIAFRLEKCGPVPDLEDRSYDVLLSDLKSECGCKGHCR